eukprot:CAMPEP_0194372028 /NCGR_PEP_ID=MMETSP0174-20130528/20325_1 /TAXON_ID=216777 /ORGANISM="Proboscia alata, Strain PI-D3" /LENGTH=696 /DNA_ID=CAMNT_0039150293 /DNA_START=93 /DNA_END=2183 /DNA_ORIENTATION=-
MNEPKSLKSSQLSAVHRMLAFNNDCPEPPPTSSSNNTPQTYDHYYPAGSAHNQWKILIYDTACRSIISPLLSVSDLRSRGVTLHLLLESNRDAIPDVPALYFVSPTPENLALVAQDCASGLYQCAHVNFVSKVPRPLMEDFARLCVSGNSLEKISSLHDQYLEYVCLEENLFSLNKVDSYVTYNGPTSDAAIEASMQDIALGLLSVVATLGCIPIIRCPANGPCEMVARKLSDLIANHPNLTATGGGGGLGSGGGRPMVVICDRNSDLITPLQHTSTYQALIDDVLDHAANRVTFDIPAETPAKGRLPPKPVEKQYDLNPDSDPFYYTQKFNPFPEAIECNGVELKEVSQREAALRFKAHDGSGSSDQMPPDSAGADLAHAVDSLPRLLIEKKQLEIHTSILQAVMNEVAQRDIPTLYELESSLATKEQADLNQVKTDVLGIVDGKGTLMDKLRVICVYSLACSKAPSTDIDEVVEALQTQVDTTAAVVRATGTSAAKKELAAQATTLQNGIKAIQYVKQLRSMQMIPQMDFSTHAKVTTPDTGNEFLSTFMKQAQNQATGFLAKATDTIGSMLGKIHKTEATRVLQNLVGYVPQSEDDTYLYLDPKSSNSSSTAVNRGDVNVASLRGRRPPVRDAVVFMIGGGCYAEYQNLQMCLRGGDKDGASSSSIGSLRSITYGSTELVNPTTFMNQLSKLS